MELLSTWKRIQIVSNRFEKKFENFSNRIFFIENVFDVFFEKSKMSLMACWKRLHLQFRHRWTSGRTSKSSNGRKIARMARNSTIFGPNESSRRDLFLEKFSKSRNNRKVFEKLRKSFETFFEKFFERCNLMGDVILSNVSLTLFVLNAPSPTIQGEIDFQDCMQMMQNDANATSPNI